MLQRYKISKVLGDGTFGTVSLAKVKETGELVAIKKMKQELRSWDECLKLKEVQALSKLKHPNIVKVKEIFREDNKLYFVFEYMKQNLYEMLKERKTPFPEHAVRNITYQILQAVQYMHRYGYFHRDLKPENILCQGPELVKLADFGQAREIRSKPPYTDYVSTRWYRAPEIQLGSTNYNSPIDIWAIACIMSEVYTGRPLFPGSGTIDQIFKFCSILGTPTKAIWSEGISLATSSNIRLPVMVPTPLSSLVPMASNEGISVMRDMLQWDPRKRPTAGQVLKHKYFQISHHHTSVSNSNTRSPHIIKSTTAQYINNAATSTRGQCTYNMATTGFNRYGDAPDNKSIDRRSQENTAQDTKAGSQDSGVASDLHHSDYFTSKALPLKPLAPPTNKLPAPPIMFSETKLMGMPLLSNNKKVVRRKDMLPDIGTNDWHGQWATVETEKVGVPTKMAEKKQSDVTPSINKNVLPPLINKIEATNFYLSGARYMPIVSGKSSKNKLGFGSSTPRFKDSASPTSVTMVTIPSVLRPSVQPRGREGDRTVGPVIKRSDMGQWCNPNTDRHNEPGRVTRRQDILPSIGNGGILKRTDWTTRYKRT